MSSIFSDRLRSVNTAAVDSTREYVIYWMIAQRRTTWSFALDRAAWWARELGKPLLVFEALRCDYRWASDRLHRFILQGMADNARALARRGVAYFPYVEPRQGAGRGLLEALAHRAAVVVSDDFPCFFLPRMVAAVGARLPCRLEVVDGNGLLPLSAADRVFVRAYDFRRFMQRTLPSHLLDTPQRDPLAPGDLPRLEALPADAIARWPPASLELLAATPASLAALPIDHAVRPVTQDGGSQAARAALERFLTKRLARYAEGRNDVVHRATSELSSYLHFGHISVHEIFARLAEHEGWNPGRLGSQRTGTRDGFWGMSPAAESFLDELVMWRELGYNMTSRVTGYDRYASLPEWARKTLEEHLDNEREYLYDLASFERAETHDELWNAAQRELRRDGRIHNYLRMLWGKKILEWSETPWDALEVMIELNNKYAVDGRNPNSYSGIFWCLGRYDRAWGPERPIYGKIRYMSSESTRRKLDAKAYLRELGPLLAG